ncbi:DNA/RNA non-specific endonuclease [Gallaecimonas pentaromativorans]|uniref:DNA/RNA non-specific endonuclease n=1 Tax=Gallaecimonas pentaromativorans TaxID=584787 RepID=UPI003A93A61B
MPRGNITVSTISGEAYELTDRNSPDILDPINSVKDHSFLNKVTPQDKGRMAEHWRQYSSGNITPGNDDQAFEQFRDSIHNGDTLVFLQSSELDAAANDSQAGSSSAGTASSSSATSQTPRVTTAGGTLSSNQSQLQPRSAESSPPAPASSQESETFNGNEAVWTVDEQGRPISVEATLKSTHSGKRSRTESKLQGSVGGDDRLEDDDGGHLIGHRFMSDQGIKNLFPQNSNLNRGAYKTMENEWADWTKEGYEVRLKVKLDPKGSSRPENIIASYSIIDPKTGKKIYKRRHNFSNKAGESFDRVKKNDMNNYGA